MSISAIEYYRRQLKALAKLEQVATPAELSFYEAVRKDSEVSLAEAERAATATQKPVTVETVRSRLSRALQFAHQLQRELREPSLGEHWHRWSEEELERTRSRIVNLQTELALLDPNHQAVDLPEPSDVLSKLEDAVSMALIRVEELEMLRGLHAAWIERSNLIGNSDVVAHERLKELDQQIEDARQNAYKAKADLEQRIAESP